MAAGSSANSITSDEATDFSCSPCAETGRIRQAVKYCVQCQDYYCQACTDNHATFPALRRHELLDQTDFGSSGSQTGLPSVPTERCKVHKTKLIDMYCKTHDAIGCTTCMALEHRICSEVQSISDVISDINVTNVKTIAQESLKTAKSTLENIRATREQALTDLQMSRQNAIKSIKDCRKELDDLLTKLEIASIQEYDAKFDATDSIVRKELKQIGETTEMLEASIRMYQKIDGNNAQNFVTQKSAEKALKASDVISQSIPLSSNIVNIVYHINDDIKTSLTLMTSFGTAQIIEQRNLAEYLPVKTDINLNCVERKTEIDVKIDSDEFPYVLIGSCFTRNGDLLISDSYNQVLKRVDVSRQCVKDYCPLPKGPYGVCCTGLQEAAVCLSGNTVQLVSLGGTMKLFRRLTCNHACFDIEYSKNELFVSDGLYTVHVYDMTGRNLRVITKSGKRHLQIAFDQSIEKLYVASLGCVLIYDRPGNHISSIKNQHLEEDKILLCSDNNGRVFVYGDQNYPGPVFRRVGDILQNQDVHFNEFLSVCFNPSKNYLCVTGTSSLISIFKVKD